MDRPQHSKLNLGPTRPGRRTRPGTSSNVDGSSVAPPARARSRTLDFDAVHGSEVNLQGSLKRRTAPFRMPKVCRHCNALPRVTSGQRRLPTGLSRGRRSPDSMTHFRALAAVQSIAKRSSGIDDCRRPRPKARIQVAPSLTRSESDASLSRLCGGWAIRTSWRVKRSESAGVDDLLRCDQGRAHRWLAQRSHDAVHDAPWPRNARLVPEQVRGLAGYPCPLARRTLTHLLRIVATIASPTTGGNQWNIWKVHTFLRGLAPGHADRLSLVHDAVGADPRASARADLATPHLPGGAAPSTPRHAPRRWPRCWP